MSLLVGVVLVALAVGCGVLLLWMLGQPPVRIMSEEELMRRYGPSAFDSELLSAREEYYRKEGDHGNQGNQ